MKSTLITLAVVAIVGSCGIYVPHPKVFYMQLPQTRRIVQDSYSNDDTLHVKYYMIDQWLRTPSRRRRPDTIPIHNHQLSVLKESLAKLPLNIKWDHTPERIVGQESHKEYMSSHYIRQLLLNNLDLKDSLTYFIPLVRYTALWQNETDGAAAKYVMVETGRVEYAFFRTFAVAVVRDNEFLYYSNHYHRDTLFLNQGKEPEHEFPQPMLDTLVTLAMKHYIERLE